MLQITVTLSANQGKVMEEIRGLEHEGKAKIVQEQLPTLIMDVPDHRNEEKVISALARFARKGFVTGFESRWIR